MKKPSSEAVAAAKTQALDEIERTADLTASYARSLGEAAYRGDEHEIGVHTKRLRDCVVFLIKLFKEEIVGNRSNDTGQTQGAAGDLPSQPAGDGVDGRRSA